MGTGLSVCDAGERSLRIAENADKRGVDVVDGEIVGRRDGIKFTGQDTRVAGESPGFGFR